MGLALGTALGINNQVVVVEGQQRIYLKQGATVQTSYIFIDITNPTDLIKTSRVSIGRPNKDWLSLKGVIWSEHI